MITKVFWKARSSKRILEIFCSSKGPKSQKRYQWTSMFLSKEGNTFKELGRCGMFFLLIHKRHCKWKLWGIVFVIMTDGTASLLIENKISSGCVEIAFFNSFPFMLIFFHSLHLSEKYIYFQDPQLKSHSHITGFQQPLKVIP